MTEQAERIKVLIAKTGLDAHWRGAMVVTAALRDAGMEVIFGGRLKSSEICEAAIQEDVDVIGLSVGGRYGAIRDLVGLLKEAQAEDKLIVAGGTIPPEDIPQLKEMGVSEVFPPESSLDDIVEYIRKCVNKK